MARALVVISLAALLGGADQYIGSLSAHPWATEVSLLSAPWVLVAFVAGCTQPEPRRGAVLGLVCTFAALVGYWLMTLSPIEGSQLSVPAIRGLITSQSQVIAGAFLTGPLFGWLGSRWRRDRWWLGALLAAAAVCLEPLARAVVGWGIRSPGVWAGEAAFGMLMVLYVVSQTRHRVSG